MTIESIISAAFLGVVSVVAAWVAIYWHVMTKGTWRHWPAGQSLMGLLGIIAIGFGWGVINRFLGYYPARSVIGILLYALFVGAIIMIGLTVRKEMRHGKKKLRDKHPDHTGPMTVVVATTNEERPDDV
jgi:hypothetical protein